MAWGPEPKLVPADVPDRIDIVPSIDILARQTGRNIYVDGRERMVRHVRAGDSAGWALFGGYFRLPQGHYAVTFTYSLAECPPEEPVTFEVMGDWGARELASAIVYGTHTNGEAVLTFEAEALMVFEPRVHYGGAGTLKIYELQIREAASGLGD